MVTDEVEGLGDTLSFRTLFASAALGTESAPPSPPPLTWRLGGACVRDISTDEAHRRKPGPLEGRLVLVLTGTSLMLLGDRRYARNSH